MLIYPAVLLLSTPTSAAPLDGATMYAKMALAMSAVRSPAAMSYDETVSPRGLSVRNIAANGVQVVHLVYSSDKTVLLFHVTQCAGADTARITDAAAPQPYTAEQPFWSAVWSRGAQSSVIGTVRERMIADLVSADDGAYQIALASPQSINGSAAYHLHLTALHDAAMHPLTDVFLDEQTFLPRRAVADFEDDAVTRVTGVVTLNFDRVGNYWMIDSGEVDATVHAYLRQVSGSAAFTASNVTFAPGLCAVP